MKLLPMNFRSFFSLSAQRGEGGERGAKVHTKHSVHGKVEKSKRAACPGPSKLPPGFGARASAGVFAGKTAFTLIEVMIALGIFFMCIFAILEVVATNLRAARKLQDQPVDVSLIIADLYQTNKLEEGSDSGDFGDLFPGYKWESQTTLVGTNGLFKVEFLVTHPNRRGGADEQDHLAILLWRPDSPQKLP